MTASNKTACFWALLSTDEFKFLYLPSMISDLHITPDIKVQDVLKDKSIFDLMHPNEVELAKNDLTNFINLKTLSGSVTRCRFRSLKNHLYVQDNKKGKSPIKENETMWHILDLVVYTATDETVLAFFHNIDFGHYEPQNNLNFTSCCSHNGGIHNFVSQDAQRLIGQLKKNTDGQENRTAKIPFSVFQVKDQASLHELFSWPQFNQTSLPLLQAVESITKSMPLVEFKSCSSVNTDLPVDSHTKVHLSSSDITCTRHFYASKKMDFENKACYFERIVIPYGSVVFEAFQIRYQTNYQLHYSYTNSFIPNNTQKGRIGNTSFTTSISITT